MKIKTALIATLWPFYKDLNFGQICHLAEVAEEETYQMARKYRVLCHDPHTATERPGFVHRKTVLKSIKQAKV